MTREELNAESDAVLFSCDGCHAMFKRPKRIWGAYVCPECADARIRAKQWLVDERPIINTDAMSKWVAGPPKEDGYAYLCAWRNYKGACFYGVACHSDGKYLMRGLTLEVEPDFHAKIYEPKGE